VDAPADSVVNPLRGEPLVGVQIPDPEAGIVGEASEVELPSAGFESLTVAAEASAMDEVTPPDAVVDGIALSEPVWSELVETAFPDEPWAQQLNTGRPDLEVAELSVAEEGDSVVAQTLSAESQAFLPGAVVAWDLAVAEGSDAGDWATMTVDYGAVADAFGANYGDRLQLMAFPACALTTPQVPACVTGVPLTTTHHEDDTTMSAVVPLEQIEVAGGAGLSVSMDGTVGGGSIIAAVSGASGVAGTFTQTPMTPDGSWGVSEQSGAFTYSVPFAVPAASAGASPDVTVGYSSASVDGRTLSTNSQSSWVGEGWDLQMPYIERLYKSCSQDGFSTRGSELCWKSPYSEDAGKAAYVMYFHGTTQELIWVDGDRYRLANDDGTRITWKTGAGNGDNNGEYFWVQTPDGAIYQFGRGIEPQLNVTTNSVATVPVYGNNTGEPRCGTSATDYCMQGYRWMLDIAFDANDNATLYKYAQETNKYAAGSSPSASVSYTSAIYPTEIDYGYQWGDTSTTFESRLLFFTQARCVDMTGTDYDPLVDTETCPNTYTSTAVQYPDVPLDLLCTATCTSAQNSPVFFLRKRLDSIRADVYAGGWMPERRRQFHYLFPPNSDGTSKNLWLENIVDIDYGNPGTASDDLTNFAINFDSEELANRVDWSDVNHRLLHRRITGIRTDTGAYVDVTYALDNVEHCPAAGTASPGYDGWHALASAAWQDNKSECFPAKYDPDGSGSQAPIWAIFHRYMVRSTEVIDTSDNDAPTQKTTYAYIGQPAWGYQSSILFDLGTGSQTWNSWRGYETVQSTTGSGKAKVTVRNQYYRGLHEDYRSYGATQTVKLTPWSFGKFPTAAERAQVVDYSYLQGMLLTSTTLEGNDEVQSSVRYFYAPKVWKDGPNVHNSVDPRVESTITFTRLSSQIAPDPVFGRTVVENTFDSLGRVTEQVTKGIADGETTLRQCTQTEYASYAEVGGVERLIWDDNSWGGRHYITLPRRVITRDMGSQTACSDGILTSRTDIFYDGADVLEDQKIVDGNPTTEQTWSTHSASVYSTATYDTFGRITKAWLPGQVNDPLPSATWTYTKDSATGIRAVATTRLVKQTAAQVDKQQTTKTWIEPVHGNVTKSQGVSGLYTHYLYDAMGRLTRGWDTTTPSAVSASPPAASSAATVAYTYPNMANNHIQDRPTAPIKITATAHPGFTGGNVQTVTFSDSLGRVRQVHTPSQGVDAGATSVVLTEYDDSGRVSATSAPIFSANGVTVSGPECDIQESCTVTTYDFAGRPLTQQLVYGKPLANGNGKTSEPKYTTTYTYVGNTTFVTPPTGVVTETTTDMFGRTTSTTLHAGIETSAPTAVTTYGYSVNPDGTTSVTITAPDSTQAVPVEMVTTTDMFGRTVSLDDPDAGITTYGYDDDSNVTSIVSAAGIVTNEYDEAGRITKRVTATSTDPDQSTTTYTYDEAGGLSVPGQLMKTAYTTDNGTYTTAISAIDNRLRPTTTTVTLPSLPSLGAFSGESYSTSVTYDDLGRVTATALPGVGPAAAETITATFNMFGQTTTLSTSALTAAAPNIVTGTTRLFDGRLDRRDLAIADIDRKITWDPTSRAPLATVAGKLAPGSTYNPVYQYTHYDYDSAGRVSGVWDEAAQQRQCYVYDDFNRLAAAWTQDGTRPTTTTEPADCAVANATTAWNAPSNASNYSSVWTYSKGGRILTASTKTNAAPNAGDTDYAYNASVPNAPTEKIPAAVSSTTGAQPGSFTYDKAGRMIARTVGGVSQTLAWDVLSNLTSVTAGTATTEYLYDSAGQRYAAISGNTATIFMGSWDASDPDTGNNPAGGTDVSVTRYYSADGAQVASWSTGGNLTLTFGDVQGSAHVSVTTNAANEVVPTVNAYTPYGAQRGDTDVTGERGWLNQVADATGLTYLNARYYDPLLGRFLSPDPLLNPGDPRTLDPYRYADNNPVVFTDASGLWACAAGPYQAKCEKANNTNYNTPPSSSAGSKAPTGGGKTVPFQGLGALGPGSSAGGADADFSSCSASIGYGACHDQQVQCEIMMDTSCPLRYGTAPPPMTWGWDIGVETQHKLRFLGAALHPDVDIASGVMKLWAEHHGATCAWSGAESITVCGGATSGFGGNGTNYGLVYVTGAKTSDVLDPSSDFYVGELRHEGRHTLQDAFVGVTAVFLLRTAGEAVTGLDPRYDFGDGCHDPVEVGAGLEDGHYTSCG
jgi:RHS repeat-associated protein